MNNTTPDHQEVQEVVVDFRQAALPDLVDLEGKATHQEEDQAVDIKDLLLLPDQVALELEGAALALVVLATFKLLFSSSTCQS